MPLRFISQVHELARALVLGSDDARVGRAWRGISAYTSASAGCRAAASRSARLCIADLARRREYHRGVELDPIFVALSDCGFPGWDAFPTHDDPERDAKIREWFLDTREACSLAAASLALDGSITGPLWTAVGARLLWKYALAEWWPIAEAFESFEFVLDETKSHDVSRWADPSR